MSTSTPTVKSEDGLLLLRDVRMVNVLDLKPWPLGIPPLSDFEYDLLCGDIAQHGIQVPIEIDDQGNVLDGHHRLRAAFDLCTKKVPVIIRRGLTEAQKRAHSFRLNRYRRHLNRPQRNEIIRLLFAEGKSTRQVAKEVGTSQATAQRVLAASEPGGSVDGATPSETVTGKDGRVRQRTSPKRQAAAEARRKPTEAKAALAGGAAGKASTEQPTPEATSADRAPEEPKRGAPKPKATAPPDEPKRGSSKPPAAEEIGEGAQAMTAILKRHRKAPPRRRDWVLGEVADLIQAALSFQTESGVKPRREKETK